MDSVLFFFPKFDFGQILASRGRFGRIKFYLMVIKAEMGGFEEFNLLFMMFVEGLRLAARAKLIGLQLLLKFMLSSGIY